MEKLVTTQAKEKKSKLQQQYETLTLRIEEKKALLRSLEEGMQEALPLVMKELKPLLTSELDGFNKRLVRLDEVAEELGVPKNLRKSFEAYMFSEITHVLQMGLDDDGELVDLQQKYGYGFSTRDVSKRQEPPEEETPKTAKKPSKKGTLMPEKDAKAVYLKLMKVFHPDRVQDAETKEKHNEISTQVIKSYKDKDYHGLLKLQIKHLKEGDTAADNVFYRYNVLLQEQLDELDQALENARSGTRGIYEDLFDHQHRFSPARFKKVKKALRQNIDRLERDYIDSLNHTKAWFKHVLVGVSEWG
jgi:hypothetical protein